MDRWERIEDTFHKARDLGAAERGRFLDDACASDAAMRQQVEALLAEDESSNSLLSRPVVEAVANWPSVPERHRLSVGRSVGPYKVLGPIGSGGMGEVYRARDTKLNRDVALKVLPDVFAADPDRIVRFKREAQLLASLNHPNIGSIYGFEDSDGVHALVLEFVDGPTLADRIARGPIPVDDALPLARQIADALDAAHERGIIHRDLKPANIKVRPDGTVKLLDFGVAKALESAASGMGDSTAASTRFDGTEAGVVFGTVAYMAPEQARDQAVDRRADVWAFGVILYEMLTGRRPFGGDVSTDTLASVLKDEPNLSCVPPKVRPLLQWCLEKDPKLRLRDISSAMHVVKLSGDAAVRSQVSNRRHWAAWSASGLFLLTALVLAILYFFGEKPDVPAPVRFQVPYPENTLPRTAFHLSPDGRQLAFVAGSASEPPRIWVRELGALESRPLVASAGVRSAGEFFWSSDSRSIAFDAAGTLRKIEVAGGPAQTLCHLPSFLTGGAWSADDVLIFGTFDSGLMRVSAAGGSPTQLTVVDSAKPGVYFGPSFLPDGKHFLYLRASSDSESDGIFIGSLGVKPEQQDSTRVLASSNPAIYVASGSRSGHVLFVRDKTLLAQSFDVKRLVPIGAPLPLLEHLDSGTGASLFSASSTGVLVYQAGQNFQLTWLDRHGKHLATLGEPGNYREALPSPDGKLVAVTRVVDQLSTIWLIDVASGRITPFTFGGPDRSLVWNVDGTRIAYSSWRDGAYRLFQKAVIGGEEEKLLKTDQGNVDPNDWSPDGKYIAYTTENPKTKHDIWLLPLDGDRTPVPFVRTKSDEYAASFSPVGHWIAYTSDESGVPQVYAQTFQPRASTQSGNVVKRWPVSAAGGGSGPAWRLDGKELTYVARDSTIMSVEVTANPEAPFGEPRPLYTWPRASGAPTWDAQRALYALPERGAPAPFTIVLNWQAALLK